MKILQDARDESKAVNNFARGYCDFRMILATDMRNLLDLLLP